LCNSMGISYNDISAKGHWRDGLCAGGRKEGATVVDWWGGRKEWGGKDEQGGGKDEQGCVCVEVADREEEGAGAGGAFAGRGAGGGV